MTAIIIPINSAYSHSNTSQMIIAMKGNCKCYRPIIIQQK